MGGGGGRDAEVKVCVRVCRHEDVGVGSGFGGVSVEGWVYMWKVSKCHVIYGLQEW